MFWCLSLPNGEAPLLRIIRFSEFPERFKDTHTGSFMGHIRVFFLIDRSLELFVYGGPCYNHRVHNGIDASQVTCLACYGFKVVIGQKSSLAHKCLVQLG